MQLHRHVFISVSQFNIMTLLKLAPPHAYAVAAFISEAVGLARPGGRRSLCQPTLSGAFETLNNFNSAPQKHCERARALWVKPFGKSRVLQKRVPAQSYEYKSIAEYGTACSANRTIASSTTSLGRSLKTRRTHGIASNLESRLAPCSPRWFLAVWRQVIAHHFDNHHHHGGPRRKQEHLPAPIRQRSILGSSLQHPQTLLGCVRTSASSLSLSNQS